MTNDVHYNRRVIHIELSGIKDRNEFLSVHSKIQNLLHGKKFKAIFSKEPNFYWVGRVAVGEINFYEIVRNVTLDITVDPYKYDLQKSNEDWIWDIFSFTDGIINECKDLIVKNSLEVRLIGRRKHITPIFEVSESNNLSVTFNDIKYMLADGQNEVVDIEIIEGINKLKFEGSGKVNISYRGGSL